MQGTLWEDLEAEEVDPEKQVKKKKKRKEPTTEVQQVLYPSHQSFDPRYFQPRYYQSQAVESVCHSLEQSTSTLVVMATGLGKTVAAAYVLKHYCDLGYRCLAIAHRMELINQMYDKFRDVCYPYGVEKEIGEYYANVGGSLPRIVVASKDTLCEPRRLKRYEHDYFDIIFIDEAHHYVIKNKSYHSIVTHFPKARLFGMTATPDRKDEISLGQTFQSVSYVKDLYDGIEDGYLVKIEQVYTQVTGYDISNVGVNGSGELSGVQVAQVMERKQPLYGVANAAIEESNKDGRQRQTIIFCASVQQAEDVAAILNHTHARRETGSAVAFSCDGLETELRKELVARFKKGEIRYFVNYGIAIEGFDCDTVEVVVIARPVKSRAVYAQMVGRGARPLDSVARELSSVFEASERRALIAASAKPKCTVVDLMGVTGKHKLITVADILGGKIRDNLVALVKKSLAEKTGTTDVMEQLKEVVKKEEIREIEALREAVVDTIFMRRYVDPFNNLDRGTLREPGWFKGKRPTKPQLEMLRANGLSQKQEEKLTFWEASKMIERILDRRKRGLCTVKQARQLLKHGYDPEDITFDRAREILDQLAANGWRPIR